jgi:hypothetical protein
MRFEANHGLVAAEVCYLSGGVPGRAGCEFITLQQHAIGDALLGKMINRGTACNTAADYHYVCLRFHLMNSQF